MANTHSIEINGSNQYLNANDSASLSFTGNFTFECWINVTTAPSSSTQKYIITKDDENTQRAWALYYGNAVYGSNREINFFVFAGGASTNYSRVNFQGIDLGTGVWHHVAVVCTIANAVATKAEIFINGISKGNGSGFNAGSGCTALADTTSKTTIGGYDGGTGSVGLACKIDDVRLWSATRTATEIAENYNTQLAGNESNLVAYWKLNNALTDGTSNGNTLTNNGSATFSTTVPYAEDGELAFNSHGQADSTSNGNTVSGTVVCSGLNRILVVAIQDDSGGGISSVTYNSVGLTLVNTVDQTGAGNGRQYLYALVNPTVGSNTLLVTRNTTSTARRSFEAVTYVGAKQTGQPDASNTNTASASTIATSVTSVADRAWHVQWCVSSGSAITMNSGGFIRGTPLSAGQKIADSGTYITPAGSSSMTWGQSSGTPFVGVCALTIAPYVSSTPITVTPSAQVVTASIPAYSVLYDKVIAVAAQVATFSVPTYAVSISKIVLPSAQVATFSIPAYTVDAGGNITVAVSVQTATFSIPAYSVLRDWVVAIGAAVTATFSTPAPTVATGDGVTVLASAVVGTFSIPAYSLAIEANTVVPVGVVTATFSLPSLAKVGAIWRKVGRSTSDTWSRVSRNST